MAERHTQRGMYPVCIHSLADILELVGICPVHGTVIGIVQTGKPFKIEFLRGICQVE